jgi:single-strand DNA-binding protein
MRNCTIAVSCFSPVCWAWLRVKTLRPAGGGILLFRFPLKVSPNKASLALGSRTLAPGRPNRKGIKKETTNMFCKNRITLIGHLGKDTETRFTTKGTAYSRFPIATNVSWKDKESGEYRTRTEWHSCVVWTKLGAWAASLKKGAFVEVEGELRYREFQPKDSDTKVRAAEIRVTSILTLDRAEKAESADLLTAESSNDDDTPF